ncbi:MAG: class I SAM-dependent methyltransferase [Planctomycetota bacterium]
MSDAHATSELGEAWLSAQGVATGFVREIHPHDEMLQHVRDDAGGETARERFLYYRAGHEALLSLENVLACAGRTLDGVESLLEFASGFGRLTRHLASRLDASRLWATDILPEAAPFLRDAFGVHAFDSVQEPAALELPRRFDVIWVGSLFSHLPRRRFGPWLRRLHEALTDDGLLIFSTHGADVVAEVPKDASGFTYVPSSESRSLAADEYGSTFVTPDVVRAIAAEQGIASLHVVERDLWWIQDLWVAARREHPSLDVWGATPLVRGRIERVEVDAQGRAGLAGWTLTAEGISPVQSVRVWVDGRDVGAAVLADEAPTRAGVEQREGYVHTDWYLQGDVSSLTPGRHALAVVGRASSGPAQCFDVSLLDTPGSTPGV